MSRALAVLLVAMLALGLEVGCASGPRPWAIAPVFHGEGSRQVVLDGGLTLHTGRRGDPTLPPPLPLQLGARGPSLAVLVHRHPDDDPLRLRGLGVALTELALIADTHGQRGINAPLEAGLSARAVVTPALLGWVLELPEAPRPEEVTRALAILNALVTSARFSASAVATFSERAIARDPGRAEGSLEWAIALASPVVRPLPLFPPTRTVALMHREDLVRLHRRLFRRDRLHLVATDLRLDAAALDDFAATTAAPPEDRRETLPSVRCAVPRTPVATMRGALSARALHPALAPGVRPQSPALPPHRLAQLRVFLWLHAQRPGAPPVLFMDHPDKRVLAFHPEGQDSLTALLESQRETLDPALALLAPAGEAPFSAFLLAWLARVDEGVSVEADEDVMTSRNRSGVPPAIEALPCYDL